MKTKAAAPPKTWVVLDVSNLAYRAAFAHGHLTHGDKPTGVAYGVLRDVKTFRREFSADHVVFCFDGGKNLRKRDFPWYKRRPADPEKLVQAEAVRDQIKTLRRRDLPACGFRNLVRQVGYEADDMMCLVAAATPYEDRVVLVTGDQDLYQVLSPRVSVYHPHKKELVTKADFVARYGVQPQSWALVKALGGCVSDGVPGLKGVGPKTALAYVRGDKGHKDPLIDRVARERQAISDFMRVVSLPYPGTAPVKVVPDKFDPAGWERVAARYGAGSLSAKRKG